MDESATREIEPNEGSLRRDLKRAIGDVGADPELFAAVEAGLFGDVRSDPARRYRPIRVKGRGAYGTVFEAHDTELDRHVALKVVRDRREPSGPRSAERPALQAEALAIARVSHPNVVQVFDVAWEDGALQIAMELISGRDLSAWLSEAHSPREVVELMIGAGRGLAAIHDAGLVHRDFKPSNVLVGDDGVARIADFGLARLLERGEDTATDPGTPNPASASDLTGTGLLVGTPAYMAPEQHAGSRVGAAADQYAFCVTLFEALTGERPFAATSLRALSRHKRAMHFGRGGLSGVPRGLARILRIGLKPDPDARFPTMHALVDALARAQRGGRRRLWAAGVAAVALTAGAATVADDDACEQGQRAMDEVWGEPRAEAIKQRLARDDASAAAWRGLARGLDAHAAAWRDGYARACDGAFPASVACFKRRRDDLASFVSVIAEGGPDGLSRAAESLRALPDPDECTAAARIGWTPPADEQAEVEALRRGLARARALSLGGRYREARDEALELAARGEPLRFRPPALEAQVVAGVAERLLGERSQAISHLEAAAWQAVAAGLDAIALEAMTGVVLAHVEDRALPEAEHWADHARAVAARIDVPRLEVELETVLSALDWERRDPAAAIARLEALLRRSDAGLSTPARLRVLLLRGSYAGDLGHADAEDWLREAQAAVVEQFGPYHPSNAEALGRRATLRLIAGDVAGAKRIMAEAQEVVDALPDSSPAVLNLLLRQGAIHLIAGEHEAAIPTLRAACGRLADDPRSLQLRECMTNLASAYAEAGHPDEAIETAMQGLRYAESADVPDHRVMVTLRMLVGDGRKALGQLQPAQREYERALTLLEQRLPGHARLAWVNTRLGDLALEMDDPAGALSRYRAALDTMKPGERPDFKAGARFGLARALRRTAGDGADSRRLAREALEVLAGSESAFAVDLRRKIEVFLSEGASP